MEELLDRLLLAGLRHLAWARTAGLKSRALSNEKRLDTFASNRLMYWRGGHDCILTW